MNDLSALIGVEVRRLLFDHQVTLFLVNSRTSTQRMSGQLILEAPFRLERDGGAADIDPARRETLPPLCGLLRRSVKDASVSGDDVLRLSFDDGSIIVTKAQPGSMSWHLLGQGVPHILIGPQ